MQFKDLGSLFGGNDSLGNLFGRTFSKEKSLSTSLLADDILSEFKIGSDGISEFTTSQIEAKSAALGLTESLTNELIAFGSDATLSAKAASGKLKWVDAIKDSKIETEDFYNLLSKSQKLPTKELDYLKEVAEKYGTNSKELRNSMSSIIDASTELGDSFITLESSAAGAGKSIGSIFKGLGASFMTFITSPAGILASFAAITVALTALQDALTVDYDEANDALSKAASEYSENQQSLESMNSELETTKSRIAELQALKDSGTITLSEEGELEKLKTQNTELERKISLQEQLIKVQSKELIDDAKDAMSKKKQSVAQSVKAGDEKGEKNPKGIVGKVTDTEAVEEDLKLIERYNKKLPELNAKVEEAKKTLSDVKGNPIAELFAKSNIKSAEKELKHYQTSIDTLQKDMTSRADTMQGQLDALKLDPTANVAEIRKLEKAIASVNEIDLTPTEKKFKKLDSFFNSSSNSGIKDALLEAAKNGENVNDVLGRMGLRLKDIGKGLSADDLTKYFDDIKKSAEGASDAIDDVNNSVTVSDIATAFESKNAGDDYVSLSDYLTKAKDLYDKGLTGTDDFKSVAEAISYNVDSSTETFKKNYDKLQRYFTKDNDGNLTAGGVSNFLNDLKSLNKGYAEFDENTGKWQLNMSNTAQAAKDMDMSVQVFEAMLGRIQDYDNVGDFKFESAIQQFNDAKDALSQLNDLYDSMDEGEQKKKLKAKLDEWTPQIENAENDLASLPKEVVTQLKFEYSRQELLSKAQEATEAAQNSGWKDVTTNANAITANNKAKTAMVSNIDMSQFQEKIPVYFDAENAIQNLQAQLASGNLSEEQTVKVQAEVANLQSVQNQILSAFHDAHPEITPETNTDQATATFQDWIASAEGQDVITKITGDNKDALDAINDLVDKDYKTTVDVNANDEASLTLSELLNTLFTIPTELTTELLANDSASPTAIALASTLSGIPAETLTSINATDGASGVLAAVISKMTGLPQEVITNLLASDNASAVASMVTQNINGVPNSHVSNLTAADNASSTANSIASAINNIPSSKKSTITIETIKRTVNEVVTQAGSVKHANGGSTAGGAMQLNGTAHASGTVIPKLSSRALAMGTLQDSSWLKPQWMTQHDDVALTGEKNEELVVNPRLNRWYTVGSHGAEFAHIPAGSVVFNSRQTKELLSKGHTNSRAKGNPNLAPLPALLNGTAYLGSSTGGFSFSGGASSYNKTSSKKKKTSSSTSSTKKSSSRSSTKSSSSSGSSSSKSSTSSNSSSSSDSSKETKETLDWIETKLDRIKRDIDLIDKTASSTYKTWSERNKALVSELSQVSNELSVQQQSYDYYIQKANSIGLDGTWAAKVRDGLISVDEITDEDLKTKISDYKTW